MIIWTLEFVEWKFKLNFKKTKPEAKVLKKHDFVC